MSIIESSSDDNTLTASLSHQANSLLNSSVSATNSDAVAARLTKRACRSTVGSFH